MNKNDLPQQQSTPNMLCLTLDGVSQLYYMLNQEEYMELKTMASSNITVTQANCVPSTIQEPEEEYMTRAEAAKKLHVDKSTLWRWQLTGKLTPIKVGPRRVLYKSEDVKRLLNSNNNA